MFTGVPPCEHAELTIMSISPVPIEIVCIWGRVGVSFSLSFKLVVDATFGIFVIFGWIFTIVFGMGAAGSTVGITAWQGNSAFGL